ncbi:390_t:CDS:2, partial [Racocetra fulgida]
MIQKKGGQYLSECYINNKSPLQWKCAKFHEWKSALCDIKKGRWCPHCAKCFKLNIGITKKIAFKKVDTRRVGLDLAKNIARSKNGEYLSDEYINIHTPLQWRCNAKLSIEEARKIATKNKGLCLSETYNGAHIKLKWQCEKKHEWYATLDK